MTPTLRVYGIVQNSIVDGPGIRFTIFTQGCSHGCKDCHNPDSHSYTDGSIYTVDQLVDMTKSDPLLAGITLTGGEPFNQPAACGELASRLKQCGFNIWTYTGYLFEHLLHRSPEIDRFLNNIDVLVDGPFVSDLKSYELRWRGSSNQRILDVKASLAAKSPVFWVASS